jgi:hypothetical protein
MPARQSLKSTEVCARAEGEAGARRARPLGEIGRVAWSTGSAWLLTRILAVRARSAASPTLKGTNGRTRSGQARRAWRGVKGDDTSAGSPGFGAGGLLRRPVRKVTRLDATRPVALALLPERSWLPAVPGGQSSTGKNSQ